MSSLWLICAAIIVASGFVVFFGAPYLPTHKKDVEMFLKVLKLGPQDVFVDLGAGDGILVRAVASKGTTAYGYELSPVVFAVAWLRCLRYKAAKIRLANLWHVRLPSETTVVYTFLHTRFMKRFDQKMVRETERLGHPIRVVSYAFEIPDKKPDRQEGALIFYTYS